MKISLDLPTLSDAFVLLFVLIKLEFFKYMDGALKHTRYFAVFVLSLLF